MCVCHIPYSGAVLSLLTSCAGINYPTYCYRVSTKNFYKITKLLLNNYLLLRPIWNKYIVLPIFIFIAGFKFFAGVRLLFYSFYSVLYKYLFTINGFCDNSEPIRTLKLMQYHAYDVQVAVTSPAVTDVVTLLFSTCM